jgi:hypothetical protein
LHLNAASGHLAGAGHGGHGLSLGQTEALGHLGQTGGTILDFKIYKSSCPFGIRDLETLDPLPFAPQFSNPSLMTNPKSAKIITINKIANKWILVSFIIYILNRKKIFFYITIKYFDLL